MTQSKSNGVVPEAKLRAERPDGPVESYPWPTTLEAGIITPGEEPRVHGYCVESDLAVHYSFAEAVLLTLTGELPTEKQAAAFDVALTFLAPLSVAHAPTHAGVLARICGARFSSISAIASVTLAERGRTTLDANGALLEWLDRASASASSGEPPPSSALAVGESERSSVSRLRKALGQRGVEIRALDPSNDLGRMPALLAALHFTGLEHREQVEAVLVLASFASTIAEARQRPVASFREYPMNVPRFVYEETDG
jgi:hypothetical protein